MDLCWVNQKNGGTKHFIGSLRGFARINQQNVQTSVILSIFFVKKKRCHSGFYGMFMALSCVFQVPTAKNEKHWIV